MIADTTTCGVATKGPCGPSNQQCGKPFGQTSPQYHVHSLSCSMNDRTALSDPVHGLYHMFYQDHLAEPRGIRYWPSLGSCCLRDLTKWARLPVAIWNDKPYDSGAIYTGSATVVNGKVVQIYPGICRKKILITVSPVQTLTLRIQLTRATRFIQSGQSPVSTRL